VKGTGLAWAAIAYKDEKSMKSGKAQFSINLTGARLKFQVDVFSATSLHALESGKGRMLFCEPDENVLGEVDVRTGARNFDVTPRSSLSAFVEGVLDAGTPIVDTNNVAVIIPPGDEDGQCSFWHDDIDPPQIMYNILPNGSLQVKDAFGAVTKAKGMALGMLLRTVGGKRVAGMPLELVNQRITAAEMPVELVFVDNPDESSEEESEEEEEGDSDIVECVFADAGPLGLGFDEGDVEDTVVVDEIKPNSAAHRFPLLKPGMIVKQVRGQRTAGMDFDQIIELISVRQTLTTSSALPSFP